MREIRLSGSAGGLAGETPPGYPEHPFNVRRLTLNSMYDIEEVCSTTRDCKTGDKPC